MVILSALGALQLLACCGLALHECLRASWADRFVLGGLALLFAILACGALAGLRPLLA